MSLGEHAPPACGCCPACRPKIVPWASAGRHYGCFAGERYAHAGRNLKILDHEHAMGSEPAFEWFGEFPELVNRKLGWPIGTPPWREPSKPGFPGTVEYTLWPRRGNSWVSSSVSEPWCRGSGGTSGTWNRRTSVDLRPRDRRRPSVFNHPGEHSLHGLLSQGGIVVEIADELAPSAHMLSTCFWIVFGERAEAASCSRNGRNKATSCSPGGRSFSSPIHERGQPLRSRQ